MLNSLLTSNFLITLIKAMKKNKTAVQNEWDRYRINNSFLKLSSSPISYPLTCLLLKEGSQLLHLKT